MLSQGWESLAVLLTLKPMGLNPGESRNACQISVNIITSVDFHPCQQSITILLIKKEQSGDCSRHVRETSIKWDGVILRFTATALVSARAGLGEAVALGFERFQLRHGGPVVVQVGVQAIDHMSLRAGGFCLCKRTLYAHVNCRDQGHM